MSEAIETQLERFRPELTGYCYRMMGSAFEAEDAVQETLIRAWRGHDSFEGRSSLRSWLYRIATNVCLTMADAAQRRVRPMDLGPAGSGHATDPGAIHPEQIWVGPIPDEKVLPEGSDPARLIAERESIRLAFVAALQHLPARQRAVLILREVLAWSAQETADLLGTSVAGINSALQRARATLAAATPSAGDAYQPLDAGQRELLGRYVKAFEAYDLSALTTLLHEDATLSMPPLALWLRGPEHITAWMAGTGIGCRGSRLFPTIANGLPAFGQYRPDPDGGHASWALIVLEIADGRIASVNSFLDTARLFPLFGLPERLT
ncbi:sigma-70 family RNA polymerase sigma factor [Actinoplanes derwentensis]|uniref:RNA polymerase, sigma subunit, ECF family n=1 Tax=Actinoplanes derwentensis TaxID=113562 RepID=A0A1H1QQJ6_9ACTN|nr:sigma-70 family RNA polymerase sigma factor [Actinoplanes derwentensis]GID89358.1 DNA-directed RNA polymerase sigma-70 factor [Actinoplanes derwentensis]SDS25666.1 RNA polymerase, sigma subunit, ECF family [Actinoplanes derwentensis]